MIYGRLATNAGYTFPQMRAMTFHEVNRLFGYWNKHPPLNEREIVLPGPRGRGVPQEPAKEDGNVITTPEEMELFVKMTNNGASLFK